MTARALRIGFGFGPFRLIASKGLIQLHSTSTKLSTTAGAGLSELISWTAPSTIPDSFNLYYSTDQELPSQNKVSGIAGSATSYTVTALPSGTWYFWVGAVIGGVEGPLGTRVTKTL